jgi:DNA-binding transcriptional ArsR family regulator
METYQQESRLYKALMHPVRLAILDLLREGEACVCHMEALLGFRQAYISQQLMVLREAGLLEMRRERLNIYYRVTCPEIFAVMDAMRKVTGVQPARPTKVNACTCPNCAAESGPRLIRL